MQSLALLALGFSGVAPLGFGATAPTGGMTASNHFDAPLVRSPSVERQAPASPGIFIPIHKPSHFPFVTIVKDDGKDPSGGWQEAKAKLPFHIYDVPFTLITWYCPLRIGMPIRHRIRGTISPTTAATMSAAVTNNVASGMDFDLPQGVFCHKFFLGVEAAFPSMYPGLGATVAK